MWKAFFERWYKRWFAANNSPSVAELSHLKAAYKAGWQARDRKANRDYIEEQRSWF
jgi:hypothetical protein